MSGPPGEFDGISLPTPRNPEVAAGSPSSVIGLASSVTFGVYSPS